MQEQEMELSVLRQPAVGAYADLFTSRAAQEMAELLAPTIAKYVDFEHGYQYGAWVKAMIDLKLIRTDKSNGINMNQVKPKSHGTLKRNPSRFLLLSNERNPPE
jgi:hypothetical protein